MKAVTIKDVAKAAGVTATTVSRVVNCRATGIGDAKRREIQQLIEEMGYRPNHLARGLVTRRSHVLGILLPNIVDTFFAEMARGVQDTAAKSGYQTMLMNTDDDARQEADAIRLLMEQKVDGILFYLSGFGHVGDLKNYQRCEGELPVVGMGHRPEPCAWPCVHVDVRKSMHMLTAYMLAQGHRQIVYMAGLVADDHNNGLLGYHDALRQHGVPPQPHLVVTGEYDLDASGHAVERLLGQKHPFTAVVCESDLMAAGALSRLLELGIRVPEEVSVAGFENTFYSRMTHPKLTSLDYPKYEMGCRAAAMMLQKLQGRSAGPLCEEMESELVLRGTTKSRLPAAKQETP